MNKNEYKKILKNYIAITKEYLDKIEDIHKIAIKHNVNILNNDFELYKLCYMCTKEENESIYDYLVSLGKYIAQTTLLKYLVD